MSQNEFNYVTSTFFVGELFVASWNVAEVKIWDLTEVMRRYGISILCIQETHIAKSPYYTRNGFLVILSGSSDGHRGFTGVGFKVAPWAKHAVSSFL